MKAIINLLILFVLSIHSFSQEKSNLTFDLKIPTVEISIFKDFLLDAGVGYNLRKNNFSIGPSFNIVYSKLNSTDFDTKTIILQPRVNFTYIFNVGERLNIEPVLGAGYSFVSISSANYNFNDNEEGINIASQIKFTYKTKTLFDYYLMADYNYTYLDENEDFTRLIFYRNIHLFSLGIGFKIKFYKNEN